MPGDKKATAGELDDLWGEINDEELGELEPPVQRLAVPLVNGDAAAIKTLSNSNTEENLGMKVQPDYCNKRHMFMLKEKAEEWTVDHER